MLLWLAAAPLPGAASAAAFPAGESPDASGTLPVQATMSTPAAGVLSIRSPAGRLLVRAIGDAHRAIIEAARRSSGLTAGDWAAILRLPELPAGVHPSFFDAGQVVSYYGFPGIPVMGALGKYDPATAIAEVTRLAAEYDASNGDRLAIPALHLIVATAQPEPGPGGTYLHRMAAEEIRRYVEATRAAGALLFLDVQIGWADPLTEVQHLEWALREAHVHLALDPEFATRPDREPPGSAIGTLFASDVNAVQRYLAELVREERLPRKILVLHQFQDQMLAGQSSYDAVAEVEITIDMDGFGADWVKLDKYAIYALAPYAERPAIKLFFEWDEPLMPPSRLNALATPPALVIYQ